LKRIFLLCKGGNQISYSRSACRASDRNALTAYIPLRNLQLSMLHLGMRNNSALTPRKIAF